MTKALAYGLAAAGLLAAAATPCRSESFFVLKSTGDAWVVMDPSWIDGPSPDGKRRAWTVTILRNLVDGGPPQPGYLRTVKDYDCAQRQVRWRTFSVYSRFGAPVLTKTNDGGVFETPSMEDQGDLHAVCDGASGASAISAPSLAALVVGVIESWDGPAAAPAKQSPRRAR